MIKLHKIAAPPAESGKTLLYVGLDGALHAINENGEQVPLGGGGSGAVVCFKSVDSIADPNTTTDPELRTPLAAGEKVILEGNLWISSPNPYSVNPHFNIQLPGGHITFQASLLSEGGWISSGTVAAGPSAEWNFSWGCGAYSLQAVQFHAVARIDASGNLGIGISDSYNSGQLTLLQESYFKLLKF